MDFKRILTAAVCIPIFFVLQTTVFRVTGPEGMAPNFILILTVIYAWLRGPRAAMICGLTGGLLIDIFFMNGLGFYALLYVYAGFVCGQAHSSLDVREFRIPILLIFGAEVLTQLLQFLFFFVLNGYFLFRYFFLQRLLPELFFTMLLFIVVYPLLLLLEERFVNSGKAEEKEDWSFIDDTADEKGGGN